MDNGAPLLSPIANFALYSGHSDPSPSHPLTQQLPHTPEMPITDPQTTRGRLAPFYLTFSTDLEF
jgi:hypothetical protein